MNLFTEVMNSQGLETRPVFEARWSHSDDEDQKLLAADGLIAYAEVPLR